MSQDQLTLLAEMVLKIEDALEDSQRQSRKDAASQGSSSLEDSVKQIRSTTRRIDDQLTKARKERPLRLDTSQEQLTLPADLVAKLEQTDTPEASQPEHVEPMRHASQSELP